MPTTADFTQHLQALAEQHRLRQLMPIEDVQRPAVFRQGRWLVDFCSNDYLGLSQHPRLIQAAHEALDREGVGSGSARLVGGTLGLHAKLEAAVAQWKGTPSALVFNSGYQANLGLLPALVQRHETILADRLNHASLVDAAQLSRARLVRYDHLDLGAVEKVLAKAQAPGRVWIVTDSVFSMDGDRAPLVELYELACRYDAWLVIDEAHATGIYGDQHRSGLWETTGLGHQDRVIQIGTFSKALGSFGAYVAASQTVIETLVQKSRSFIYSTALPPATVAANLVAVELVTQDPSLTQALWNNIRYLEAAARQAGLPLKPTSPIIPCITGACERALAQARRLEEAGLFVQPIRPPSVPEGTARLRITLSALHTPSQIDTLVSALAHTP